MFGPKLHISLVNSGENSNQVVCVSLVPLKESDIDQELAGWFSDINVRMFIMSVFGATLSDEQEWYEKTRTDKESIAWGILPDGAQKPIGVTSLHNINTEPTSGIVIWNKEWWGKGIATRAHLMRTWFGANYIYRLMMIRSTVYAPNQASLKALQRVGYAITGELPRQTLRGGVYIDRYNLTWFNPAFTDTLYPDGIPAKYQEAVDKARAALELANGLITF